MCCACVGLHQAHTVPVSLQRLLQHITDTFTALHTFAARYRHHMHTHHQGVGLGLSGGGCCCSVGCVGCVVCCSSVCCAGCVLLCSVLLSVLVRGGTEGVEAAAFAEVLAAAVSATGVVFAAGVPTEGDPKSARVCAAAAATRAGEGLRCCC